jgi:hypothetical protein
MLQSAESCDLRLPENALESPAFGKILQAGSPRLLQVGDKGGVLKMNARTEALRAERARWTWTALLLVSCAVALFCLVYPIWVTWPFRHQGATELALALKILEFRPIVMGIAVFFAAFAAVQCWRAQRTRWKRGLAVLGAIAVFGFAALARINIYELMFHPVDRPEFVAANATKLDGAEKVLAIRIGDEARAYPIRSISYHHVVNDRLGGVPIVATY